MAITVNIDGKECLCEKGEYIYDVAKRNGIVIPTYCRSDAFPDHRASCRMCIVELEQRGRSRIVASCVYPIDGPCNISTTSPRILEDRAVLRALIRESESEAEEREFTRLIEIKNDKCILCGLCVQACESLGTGAISLVNRGVEKDVDTPYLKPNKACVGCLSCANVCPTDAIEWSETETTRSIWHREFKLARCSHCGEVLGTVDSLEYSRKKSGKQAKSVPIETSYLCDECRKEELAKSMKDTYRLV
ncbi:MAG: 4Fe-4S dicluster domain-containing protein [Coriobacteriales bacterium]|nr:4Fe-4S dicluster domain-containing protein [Coriobacteriales bacterium]